MSNSYLTPIFRHLPIPNKMFSMTGVAMLPDPSVAICSINTLKFSVRTFYFLDFLPLQRKTFRRLVPYEVEIDRLRCR